MNFPRYQAYKASGVDWLGEVPQHWSINRLKLSIDSCTNGVWGEEESNDENDVACIRVADFDRQHLEAKVPHEPTIRNVSDRDIQQRSLRNGDLLIEKSGGGERQPVGAVVLYTGIAPAVCSNFVARMRIKEGLSPSFWRYTHHAAYSVRLNTKSIKQTSGIQNLDQKQYLDESAAFPPLDEQLAIASFLDRETATIDALITEQERLIELLQEKRQAVISYAVTKGLKPNATMKDSGEEWLGEVPEHWKMLQLRYSLESLSQGSSPTCAQGPAEKGHYGVLKTGCVNQIDFVPSENKALPDDIEPELSSEIRPDDVLMSRGNTKDLVGLAVVVPAGIEKLLASDLIFILRFNTTITMPEFAALFIRSIAGRHQIEPRTVGTSFSMQKINQSTIKSFFLALPPIEEQHEIASRLKVSIDKSEQLLKQSRMAVDLLQERRSALISAAVTGQIDVRGLVPGEETA